MQVNVPVHQVFTSVVEQGKERFLVVMYSLVLTLELCKNFMVTTSCLETTLVVVPYVVNSIPSWVTVPLWAIDLEVLTSQLEDVLVQVIIPPKVH